MLKLVTEFIPLKIDCKMEKSKMYLMNCSILRTIASFKWCQSEIQSFFRFFSYFHSTLPSVDNLMYTNTHTKRKGHIYRKNNTNLAQHKYRSDEKAFKEQASIRSYIGCAHLKRIVYQPEKHIKRNKRSTESKWNNSIWKNNSEEKKIVEILCNWIVSTTQRCSLFYPM